MDGRTGAPVRPSNPLNDEPVLYYFQTNIIAPSNNIWTPCTSLMLQLAMKNEKKYMKTINIQQQARKICEH
jgi:hypothetical protein